MAVQKYLYRKIICTETIWKKLYTTFVLEQGIDLIATWLTSSSYNNLTENEPFYKMDIPAYVRKKSQRLEL